MIFKIDDSIMKQEQPVLPKLAPALLAVSEKGHAIQASTDVFKWIETEILQTDQYLGKLAREQIMHCRELFFPVSMKIKYETSVTIGYQKGMYPIEYMLTLLNEASEIVVENARYDKAAIKKWLELYRKERGLDRINGEVHKALCDHRLRFYHAGGGNVNIINAIEGRKNIYGTVLPYKITTIYDSDRTSAADSSEHNRNLKDYLSNNGIAGHELMKREIENYFAFNTYRRAGFIRNEPEAQQLSPTEWDFHDFEKSTIFGKLNDKGKVVHIEKKDVETLSDLLTKDELKARVQDPAAAHDEIQRIIFLLAKFI